MIMSKFLEIKKENQKFLLLLGILVFVFASFLLIKKFAKNDNNFDLAAVAVYQTKNKVELKVPFVAQAPLGNWNDPKQKDGCEEASALMAIYWANGGSLTLLEAEKEIIKISDYEQEHYGSFYDTSAQDTVDRIFKGYFNYENVDIKYNIEAQDIKNELSKGNLIIIPINGQRLNNPSYLSPGPPVHMLVVIGYDNTTNEFITNDLGIRSGKSFRYSEKNMMESLRDYPSGFRELITEERRAMIIVSKS